MGRGASWGFLERYMATAPSHLARLGIKFHLELRHAWCGCGRPVRCMVAERYAVRVSSSLQDTPMPTPWCRPSPRVLRLIIVSPCMPLFLTWCPRRCRRGHACQTPELRIIVFTSRWSQIMNVAPPAYPGASFCRQFQREI